MPCGRSGHFGCIAFNRACSSVPSSASFNEPLHRHPDLSGSQGRAQRPRYIRCHWSCSGCRAIQGWAVGAYRGALHRIYGLDRPSEPCVCGPVRQRARVREAVTPVCRDSRSPRVHGERAGQAEFRLLRPPCGTSKRMPCASGNCFEKLIVFVARRI
jgi:hypothetical protein